MLACRRIHPVCRRREWTTHWLRVLPAGPFEASLVSHWSTERVTPTITLFISLFTTLLAIINPLEAIPVYLGLTDGKPDAEQRRVARQACIYALLLSFFFLLFGTMLLRLFDVSLSMVRVVGGVILTRVGFELFNPPPSGGIIPRADDSNTDVAFVPLAMPIMFGPGAIATLISMASTIKQSPGELTHFFAASAAIVACMLVTYLSLIYAKPILRKMGKQGIDAATRIVGFFVAAMGMGLIFNGAVEFLEPYRQVAKVAAGV
jgi:multiple antibiotic resistance protein